MHLSRRFICRESPPRSFKCLLRLIPRCLSLSSPNKPVFPLVLDNEAWLSFPFRSYHFRTFSIAAMTLLMSSFALLRVSARTDLPDIAAVGLIYFFKARRQFRHNANSRAHRGATAHARAGRAEGGGGSGCSCTMKTDVSPCCVGTKTAAFTAKHY